jgi:hypothetical protein
LVSVVACWEGRCEDLALQTELVARVAELAAFARAVTAPDRPIERFDGVIEGPILLEPGLLPAGHPAVGEDGFGRLPRLALHGVSVEPRFAYKRYPGHCTVDVVFVRDPSLPALDGRMVSLKRGEPLALYDSQTVRAASAYIASPSIHLRYQYESWLDVLMRWIKAHFVETLWYWRHEDVLSPASTGFAPEDVKTRDERWSEVRRAFAEETGRFDLPQVAAAARAAKGLPWVWIADRALAVGHVSRAASAVAPRETWPALRRAAAVAVLKTGLGANLDYMPLVFAGRDFAVSSRFKDGGLIIDVDVAPTIPPRRIVVADMRPRTAPRATEKTLRSSAPGKVGRR